MKREIKERKGYYYTLEEDKIREYLRIAPSWRLQWLEDANAFIWKALRGERRRIWERFRRGEI